MAEPTKTPGIHHVTCIAGDPQQNIDFWVEVLGLRLVKRSINQDDPGTYHFFFADDEGTLWLADMEPTTDLLRTGDNRSRN